MLTWLKRLRFRLLTLLFAWVTLSFILAHYLYPEPMVVVPRLNYSDAQHISKISAIEAVLNRKLPFMIPLEGFSADGDWFTFSPALTQSDKLVHVAYERKQVAIHLISGETRDVDYSWSREREITRWYRDYPLALDDLGFMPRNETGWSIYERNKIKILYRVPATFDPVLARRSPDNRWLAIQSKQNDTLLVDLQEQHAPRTLAREQIVQFSPDSLIMYTRINPEGKAGLVAWDLLSAKPLWINTTVPIPSLLGHLLQLQESDPDRQSDFRSREKGMKLTRRDIEPLLIGSGQALYTTTVTEWKSPWADWLIQQHWHGIGTGSTWTKHHVVDLQTGSVLASAPRSCLGMNQCIVSPTGEYLAIHGRHQAPWLEQWAIYRLPFKDQYAKACLLAAVCLMCFLAVIDGLRGVRRMLKCLWGKQTPFKQMHNTETKVAIHSTS